MRSSRPIGVLGSIFCMICCMSCAGKTLDVGRAGPSGQDPSNAGAYASNATSLLIPDQRGAVALQVDETFLYWLTVNWGDGAQPLPFTELHQCAKDDCVRTQQISAKLPANSIDFNVASGVVYVGAEKSIVSCPLTACTSPATIAAPAYARDVALDRDRIYWSDYIDKSLLSCPVAGCADAREAPVTGVDAPMIVVDGANLYFVAVTSVNDNRGKIMMVPKDGSQPPVEIATEQTSPSGLVVRGGAVYWTTNLSVGRILRCPTSGCSASAAEVLADHRFYPSNLVVDEDNLYWIEGQTPSEAVPVGQPAHVTSCKVQDCNGTIGVVDAIASFASALNGGYSRPLQLVGDTEYLYWIDSAATDINSFGVHNASIHRTHK